MHVSPSIHFTACIFNVGILKKYNNSRNTFSLKKYIVKKVEIGEFSHSIALSVTPHLDHCDMNLYHYFPAMPLTPLAVRLPAAVGFSVV